MTENTLTVHDLRCESRVNPIGIDRPEPLLSWALSGAGRARRQSAYHVLVASSPALLAKEIGDRWDSGKVLSEASVGIEFAGTSLAANQNCFWKVRVWDEADMPASWSESAEWTMGLLRAEDWQAQWIAMPAGTSTETAAADTAPSAEAASPWLRKTFSLEAVPARARVYVNAVGYFELHVNGRKVGRDVLSPAVSVLKRRTWVLAYDVTSYLQPGENAIGLWLGRGWNAKTVQGVDDERPRARLQGHLQFADSARCIVSDATWKCEPSPYTTLGPWAWNQYGGERYDARLENPDWCHPRWDGGDWSPVEVLPDPGIPASAQSCPVNRIGKRIPAARCIDLGEGRFELDFGTALSGWMRMGMPQLPSGTQVKFYYADQRYATTSPEDELTPAGIIKSSYSDRLFPDKSGGSIRYQVFSQVDEFIAGGGA
jgi:alpha-L-rhamnosidase